MFVYIINQFMKNLIKYSVLGLSMFPVLASAANAITGGPTSAGDVWTIINNLLGWMVGLFFLAATVFILLAGFKYMTAAGDESKVTEAKNYLTYAVIGIAVGLLAFAIPNILASFLKVNVPTGGPAGQAF